MFNLALTVCARCMTWQVIRELARTSLNRVYAHFKFPHLCWVFELLACKQALFGLFRDLLSHSVQSKARGQAREGEPVMALVWFKFSLLFRLTDMSSYQIEMNQSQQKRKWPSVDQTGVKKWHFWYMWACLHVRAVVINSNPETLKKTFQPKAGRKPLNL